MVKERTDTRKRWRDGRLELREDALDLGVGRAFLERRRKREHAERDEEEESGGEAGELHVR